MHQELENIKKNGKIIKYYIEERIASIEYKKELGFINMIRKDFERLSELLTENQGKTYGIDRIILYIDDLDRCPPKKVIEIINAIHLLLFSRLFMVVVAVDIRWISKCLLVEYEQLFAGDSNSAASTYDYLEKIFQIPIRIQQINSKERIAYIRGLLMDDVITVASNLGEKPRPYFGGDVDVLEEDEPVKPRIQSKDIRMSINKLTLTTYDIDQMTSYIDILGNTPRNLKRFVNIFRLIKVKSDDNLSTGLVLFLLSIAVGFPHTSYLIFKEIMNAKDGDLILEVIENLGKSLPKENDEIKKLLAFLQKNQESTIFNITLLKKLAPLISRYSFYLNDLD